MMPKFSQHSKDKLKDADEALQKVLQDAIQRYDFSVICSTRGKAEQEAAFKNKASKAHFGQSPHNYYPSLAVDLAPWPCDWKDIKKFEELAKQIKHSAKLLKIEIEWGGGWKKFPDYPHFQLANWKTLAKTRERVKK